MRDIIYTAVAALVICVGVNMALGATSESGIVSLVTGTAPVVVANGTTTPAVSMHVADGTHAGYVSSSDWTAFNAKVPLAGGTLSGLLAVPLGLQLSTTTTKPTCDVTARGDLWIDRGGAGVTDTLYACLKAVADTYSWVSVKTGG